jgi:hypothetical protein
MNALIGIQIIDDTYDNFLLHFRCLVKSKCIQLINQVRWQSSDVTTKKNAVLNKHRISHKVLNL